MQINRSSAKIAGWLAIALAIGFQLFNDFFCYEKTLLEALVWLWFPLIPLFPAVMYLFTSNPARAIGAALTVIPFYLMAYHTDCVLPYQGGGASMIYVVVIFFGTPAALIIGFFSGWLIKISGEAN